MLDIFDKNYWDSRYKQGTTSWDLTKVSPPLKTYIDQLTNSNLKILIPGGGYSYEAEYLWNKGFKNVFVIDLSSVALENFQGRVIEFPKLQLIQANFFDLNDTFDLILEQTFFCALHPSLRGAYAQKMAQLLNPSGLLVGLLFDFPLTKSGPPFGGSAEEYARYFEPYFDINIMERSCNSAKPRDGSELFIKLVKLSA